MDNDATMAKPKKDQPSFTGLPDELLLHIYSELIEDLVQSGNMNFYRGDYINKYLRTAIDIRTHRIAAEAFATSSFFEHFALKIEIKGSREDQNRYPQLRGYSCVKDRPHQTRLLLPKAANSFFRQWGYDEDYFNIDWVMNVYNQPARKRLFGRFPNTIFAQQVKKIEIRITAAFYDYGDEDDLGLGLWEPVQVTTDEWLQRISREVRMILRYMTGIEKVSIGHDRPGVFEVGNTEHDLSVPFEGELRGIVEERGLRLIPGRCLRKPAEGPCGPCEDCGGWAFRRPEVTWVKAKEAE